MTPAAPRIAVVDDDLSVRRGLERLLRSAGYQVETFSSAHDFLGRASSADPDCLILDVTMPGQSGLQLHADLLASGRAIPVIFISGQGDTAVAERGIQEGAFELLAKPFDDEALVRAVERAIGRARRPNRT